MNILTPEELDALQAARDQQLISDAIKELSMHLQAADMRVAGTTVTLAVPKGMSSDAAKRVCQAFIDKGWHAIVHGGNTHTGPKQFRLTRPWKNGSPQ